MIDVSRELAAGPVFDAYATIELLDHILMGDLDTYAASAITRARSVAAAVLVDASVPQVVEARFALSRVVMLLERRALIAASP